MNFVLNIYGQDQTNSAEGGSAISFYPYQHTYNYDILKTTKIKIVNLKKFAENVQYFLIRVFFLISKYYVDKTYAFFPLLQIIVTNTTLIV